MMNGEAVIITGISGFIGSHLFAFLLIKGIDVYGLARKQSDMTRLYGVVADKSDGNLGYNIDKRIIKFEQYDEIYGILNNLRPKCIIHIGGYFVAEHEKNSIYPLLDSNVVFTTYLVDAAVASGCLRFITTSTYWEYYRRDKFSPVDLYASTKRAAEDILFYYHQRKELSVVVLTIFETFGKGDWRNKILNIIRDAEEGESIELTIGSQRVHMVYIDDVCEAYYFIMNMLEKKNIIYERYSLFSQKSYTLKEILEKYVSITGGKIMLEFGRKPLRKYEIMNQDNIGVSIPDFFPKLDMETGLRKYTGII